MNEYNSKNNKIFIIVLIISLIFLTFGIYNIISYQSYIKNGTKVKAQVVNILTYPDSNDNQYEIEIKEYNALLNEYKEKGVINDSSTVAIIISFEYNNETYEKELGYYSDSIHIGQFVNIYLKDVNNFMYEGKSKFSIYASLIIGIILLIISLGSLFIIYNNKKAVKYLIENGNKVKAKILYCDVVEKIEKFNKHPYIVTCNYIDDDKKEYVFVSGYVYLKKSIDEYIDKYVNVYVDKKNSKNYYINIDEIFNK